MEHDHLNKLSITFQQKDQCEIWLKLAKWFPKNHDFIHVNSTVAGKYYKYTEKKKKRRVNFIPKFHSSLKKFVKYFTMITKRYMYGTKVPNFIGL